MLKSNLKIVLNSIPPLLPPPPTSIQFGISFQVNQGSIASSNTFFVPCQLVWFTPEKVYWCIDPLSSRVRKPKVSPR